MTLRTKFSFVRFALMTSIFAATAAFAQDAGEAASEASAELDPALKEEIAYVEALVEYGFPDFAETVIAETKKKWPESEALFFAVEIRGMLLLGKGEEAEKMIAALPDRKSYGYTGRR